MKLIAIIPLLIYPLLATSLILPHLTHPSTLANLTLPLHALQPRCVRITNPPMHGLRPTTCEVVKSSHCHQLISTQPAHLVRNQWVWTEEPGCAMGWYFSSLARIPRWRDCEGAIYGGIIERCATNSEFNGGAVNVEVLPSFGTDGEPTLKEEGMYIMAPGRMTL